jgi:hypothetical protein
LFIVNILERLAVLHSSNGVQLGYNSFYNAAHRWVLIFSSKIDWLTGEVLGKTSFRENNIIFNFSALEINFIVWFFTKTTFTLNHNFKSHLTVGTLHYSSFWIRLNVYYFPDRLELVLACKNHTIIYSISVWSLNKSTRFKNETRVFKLHM